MAVRPDSPGLLELIDPAARFEELAAGFRFAEGPAWDAARGHLLFTDLTQSQIWKLDETGASIWREPTNKANGLAIDHGGRLIACEAGTSVLSRIELDGRRTVLASEWQGKELNSPNDVIVAADGSLYFTDPHYGRGEPPHGVPRPRHLDFQGVFRVAPGGALQLLADDFVAPNGLALSPDESLLYVIDTLRMHIRVFDRLPDGGIANGRIFIAQSDTDLDVDAISSYLEEHDVLPFGIPDGMKVDELGNVWVTGPGGIWVVSPSGERIGVLETPDIATNIAFGGEDGRTLYVCATRSVHRIPTLVRGASS